MDNQTIAVANDSHPNSFRNAATGPFRDCVNTSICVHAVTTLIVWSCFIAAYRLSWLVLLAAGWVACRQLLGRAATKWSFLAGISALAAVGVVLMQPHSSEPRLLVVGPFTATVLSVVVFLQFALDAFDACVNNKDRRAAVVSSLRGLVKRVPLRLWGYGFVGLMVGYLFILPIVDIVLQRSFGVKQSMPIDESLTFAETIRVRTTTLFMTVWFFVLGTAVGSFLNVVVYRAPRRQMLFGRRSACPVCGAAIAGRDNLPVWSWIQLRGRCRACGTAISARYPVVEALTGSVFLLLFFVELISGGRNLPVRPPNSHAGVVWILLYTKWDLVVIYFAHCLLLCTLLAWSLIRYDENRTPLRTMATMFVIVLAGLAVWPHIGLVSWNPATRLQWPLPLREVFASAGIGGLTGLMAGAALDRLLRAVTQRTESERELIAGTALTGLLLGWQAVLSVSAGTLLLCWLQSLPKRKFGGVTLSRWPAAGNLFLAATIHLLTWHLQFTYLSGVLPTRTLSMVGLLVWLLVVAGLTNRLWSEKNSRRPGTTAIIPRKTPAA